MDCETLGRSYLLYSTILRHSPCVDGLIGYRLRTSIQNRGASDNHIPIALYFRLVDSRLLFSIRTRICKLDYAVNAAIEECLEYTCLGREYRTEYWRENCAV